MLTWNDYYPHTLRQVQKLQLPHAEVLAEHHAKAFTFYRANVFRGVRAPDPELLEQLQGDQYRALVNAMLTELLARDISFRLEFLEAVEHPLSPRALVRDYFAA